MGLRESAYFRWMRRGRRDGDSWTDWFDAEKELAQRETGLRRDAVLLAATASFIGLLIDVSKPVLWHDWQPLKTYGWILLSLMYLGTNSLSFLTAFLVIRKVKDWYAFYPLFGLALLLAGVADMVIEFGEIPIAWHGGLAFCSALTIGFRRVFLDLNFLWNDSFLVVREDRQLDIRKETMKEMQWALTTFAQIWAAFTAIFGVSMTILFKSGDINAPDPKATGIQMTLGFGGCIFVAYWWGLSCALRIMQDARKRWLGE